MITERKLICGAGHATWEVRFGHPQWRAGTTYRFAPPYNPPHFTGATTTPTSAPTPSGWRDTPLGVVPNGPNSEPPYVTINSIHVLSASASTATAMNNSDTTNTTTNPPTVSSTTSSSPSPSPSSSTDGVDAPPVSDPYSAEIHGLFEYPVVIGPHLSVAVRGTIVMQQVSLFTFDEKNSYYNITVSADKLTVAKNGGGGSGQACAFGSVGFTSGVHYWELKVEQADVGSIFVGVAEKPCTIGSTISISSLLPSTHHSTLHTSLPHTT